MIWMMRKRFKYLATISYIFFIVLINWLFTLAPFITVFGGSFSPIDIIVGSIYLVRDFAQREIKHYVMVAMLIAGVLSYLLADKAIAIASVSAFIVGESIDWAIYTFTKRPLSKRLLWSAMISSPFDSFVFLYVAGHINPVSLTMMVVGKLFGVFVLWLLWKKKKSRDNEEMAVINA